MNTVRMLLTAALLASPLSALALAEIGQPAPDFRLQSANGEMVSLSDFAGKTVILEWTNHDCPFVRKHYDSGNMQSLQERYTDEDTVWLSIISSAPGKQGHVSAAEANALTTSRKAAPTHVLFDPEGTVGQAYGAKTTPHMYVIRPDGALLAYNGAIDSIRSSNVDDVPKATNYVQSAMLALAVGEDPDPALTRPYGCSIKYP